MVYTQCMPANVYLKLVISGSTLAQQQFLDKLINLIMKGKTQLPLTGDCVSGGTYLKCDTWRDSVHLSVCAPNGVCAGFQRERGLHRRLVQPT